VPGPAHETGTAGAGYRPLLFSIAYRMTGSVGDAEDIVQDTFVGLTRARQAGITIADPKAYLTTAVTRLGINYLSSARAGTATHSRRKPMSDLQAIADRVEIEALRGELTDAAMMRDYDRTASLFTADGAVRIPHINAEAVGREEIRAGSERLQALLDCFVQTTHSGTIQLDGDTATGRAYISELIRFRDGRSELNYGIYHDRYQRTPDGWKFTERVYEIRYLDTSPLTGSAPHAADSGR
jgi:DNA-directed RNA polymerase specialized sigma24 family protein